MIEIYACLGVMCVGKGEIRRVRRRVGNKVKIGSGNN